MQNRIYIKLFLTAKFQLRKVIFRESSDYLGIFNDCTCIMNINLIFLRKLEKQSFHYDSDLDTGDYFQNYGEKLSEEEMRLS